MSMSSGWLEEEILTLEREIWQLPDLSALTRRLVGLEQGLAASWATLGFNGPTTLTATFTGHVYGNDLSGSTTHGVVAAITIRSETVPTESGSATSDATGAYSGTISLTLATVVDVEVTPTSPRWESLVGSQFTDGMSPGVNRTLNDVNLVPAPGYLSFWTFPEPIKDTLSIHDSALGTDSTLTYDGSRYWTGQADASHKYRLDQINGTLEVGPGPSSTTSAGTRTGPPATVSLTYTRGVLGTTYPAGTTLTITEAP